MKKSFTAVPGRGITATRKAGRTSITAAAYNGFDESEFDEYQLEEIRNGLKKGLDVSWYANPEFDRWQMRQIRYGLEEGVDVSWYADPKFSSSQMYEIHEGLEEGLDVSIYADPKYGYWAQMRQIRYGLEDGLDVSQYADPSLRWDKMEKIRKSLANRPPQSEGYEVYRTDTGDELTDLLNIMIHEMAFEPEDIADWCDVPVDKLYKDATVEDLIGLLTESGTIEQLEGTSCEYLMYDEDSEDESY